MIISLSIATFILSITVVVLIIYILNQKNKLEKQIDKTDLKDNYIEELKKDKKQLMNYILMKMKKLTL